MGCRVEKVADAFESRGTAKKRYPGLFRSSDNEEEAEHEGVANDIMLWEKRGEMLRKGPKQLHRAKAWWSRGTNGTLSKGD